MSEKILFVDDEPNVLNAYKRQFRKQFLIITASSGREGLEVIEKEGPFSVVVADMQMPKMDGITFLKKVQQKAPNSVRLMLTGNADQQTAIEAVNEGNVFRFLTKPCPSELLGKTLESALEQNKLIHAREALAENEKKLREANEKLAQANQDLEQLARNDGLTGIYNRRHFDETLQAELHRHARIEQPLSLILADIDFFKLYNDQYGHQGGDDCLKQVAKTINKNFNRAGDMVARYGGEEFAIIVPNLNAELAYNVADRMRQAVESKALPHSQSKVSDVVTLSVGVSTIIPNKTSSPEELIKQADKALYLAKSKGRNNVKCDTE